MNPKFLLQRGYSFLEILITLVILTIGILSVTQAEVIVLRHAQLAYTHTIASEQLANMLECWQNCNFLPPALRTHCREQEYNLWQYETNLFLPHSHCQLIPRLQAYQLELQWPSLNWFALQAEGAHSQLAKMNLWLAL